MTTHHSSFRTHLSRKSYPAYKPSGEVWLGDVPEHWDVKRAKGLLARNDGGVWGEDFDDDGVIVLRSTEQTVDGEWKIVEPAKRRLTATEFTSCRLQAGDLVVTKSSGSSLHIGKTSIVTKEVEALNCCYSNFMQRLRVKRMAEPRFVWYVLNGELGRKQFDYYFSTTTGLANLNGSIIGNVGLAVPPLDEQKAIAAFLDRETARIDALIEKKRRQIELLQEKRPALISHAVTKGLDPNAPMKPSGIEWLGQIPKHWEVLPLKRVLESVHNGTTATQTVMSDQTVPVTRIETISQRVVDLSRTGYLTWEPSLEKYRVQRGDILFSHINSIAMVGNSALMEEDISLYNGMNVLRIRPQNTTCSKWLWYAISSDWARWRFGALAKPAINQASLPISEIKAFLLPIPPREEQKDIALYLDNRTRYIDIQRRKVEQSIDLLREHRTALISAAVTGKIDVQGEVAE